MLGEMFKFTCKLTAECHLLKAVSSLLLSRTATSESIAHSLQVALGNQQIGCGLTCLPTLIIPWDNIFGHTQGPEGSSHWPESHPAGDWVHGAGVMVGPGERTPWGT